MNAIYTRQSVDRADSISIESQIEFCKYEMRGEAYKVYTDRGYSGKNTDRPAFAEMMNDIENGIISKVVVYKLDRISRSILDFSTMMERFEKYKVEFVSTTEKFDTSSPMGRAMLNICIVFAQLERVTILYASGSGKCGHTVDDLCQLGDDHNHSQCTGGNDQQRCGFGAQLSHHQGKRGGAYRKTRDLKGSHASVQLEDRPHAGE